ncbi:MAG: hypothetical protein PF904_05035 [Kiritimatiellae bacterium]|jgi:hypothetical protein|nr:hypothetical protein [Kiritimatiellia bacterium]
MQIFCQTFWKNQMFYFALDSGAATVRVRAVNAEGASGWTYTSEMYKTYSLTESFVYGDASLSFQNSTETVFEGNRVYYGGKYRVGSPEAIAVWKDNVFFGPFGSQLEPNPDVPVQKQKAVTVGRERVAHGLVSTAPRTDIVTAVAR